MTPATATAHTVFSDVEFTQTGNSPAHEQWSEFMAEVDGSQWHLDTLGRVFELTFLREDWNSYGSPPISSQAIDMALTVVMESLRTGWRLPEPEVVPTSEGGVVFIWEHQEHELELDLMPDGRIGYLLVQEDDPVSEGETDYAWDEVEGLLQWVSATP